MTLTDPGNRALATAQLTDAYLPIVDGVSVTVRNYALWLNRTNRPAVVIAPSAPGYRDREEFEVVRYLSLPVVMRRPYRLGLPRLDPRLERRLKRVRFDLVHCHSPFSAETVARRLARRCGAPLVATFHSKYREDLERAVPIPWLVRRRVARIVEFLETADEVWIPSGAAIDTLREYGYRGPVEVVAHGTDMTPSPNPSEDRKQAQDLFRVDGHRPVLLYVGQLIWEKNLELVMRSLEQLKRAGSRFAMVFVGEGYAHDGLRRMAERLGVLDRVRFAGVIRDRAALQVCYAGADLFLFPSRYDTLGLVVREAAAQSVPTVFVRGADAAEGVVDGVNGFVADGSSASYARRILSAVEDPELLRRCGTEARRTLCRPWSAVIEEVAARYREIVARHRSRKPG